jgi:hypothetical protein
MGGPSRRNNKTFLKFIIADISHYTPERKIQLLAGQNQFKNLGNNGILFHISPSVYCVPVYHLNRGQ